MTGALLLLAGLGLFILGLEAQLRDKALSGRTESMQAEETARRYYGLYESIW